MQPASSSSLPATSPSRLEKDGLHSHTRGARDFLTAEELRSCLFYCPATGIFTWKSERGGMVSGSRAGNLHPGGYIRITIAGRTYFAHRLAYLYVLGRWPRNSVDHRDGDRSNNRWNNLREATRAENLWNARRSARNSSGVKGVGFHKASGLWYATISVNRTVHSLGYFKTKQEAEITIRAARPILHGRFARQA